MRSLVLGICLIFIGLLGLKAEEVSGYYVGNNNDTVLCTFDVPKALGKVGKERVQWGCNYTISPSKKETKFKSTDIKAFTFYFKKDTFVYRRFVNNNISGPIFKNTSYVYYKVEMDGYLKEYTYCDWDFSRSFGNNSTSSTGRYITKTCLQKGNEEPFVVPGLFYKKSLRKYLSDYPELADKIGGSGYKVGDLDKIVKEYNAHKGKM